MRSSARRLLAWAAPLAFLGVLFLLPVGRLLSLGFAADWSATLADPRTGEALANTLGLAALATGISVVVGLPTAYLLYRRDFAGAATLRNLVAVPFVLPVIVVAVGFTAFQKWHTFYSQFGMDWLVENRYYWITAALVFMNLSIVVRAVGSQWAALDTETEEAAALDGAGRLRTALAVSLPQLAGTVAAAATLVFLYCASSFGIVLVLGGGSVRTLETEVSVAVNSYLDLPKAAALSLAQVAITAVTFAVASALSRGSIGLTASEPVARQARLDRRDWPILVVAILVVAPTLLLPLVSVVTQSFIRGGHPTLANYVELGGLGARDLLDITVFDASLNSVRNTAIASALAISVGTLIAVLLHRTRNRALRNALDTLFLLPMGVSMVVLGFGYLISFDTEPLALRSTWMIVPLAQSIAALPQVVRLIYPALAALDRETQEAAAVDGATENQIWWRVQLPQIASAVKTAIGYAVVACIGEFGAASFLAFGDQATLPTVLYRLIARPGAQNFGMAMAVATILIALTFTTVALVSRQAKARAAKTPH